MHEVGLVQDAVAQAVAAAEAAHARAIERVTFVAGAGGHITPEIVTTLFAALSRDTLAAGAEVVVEMRERLWRCLSCGAEFGGGSEDSPCPVCGGLAWPTGDVPELALTSVDVAT